MMSDMEKKAQVGELVLEREVARTNVAHMRAKRNKIAAAYSAFGAQPERWSVDASGGVFLSNPKGEDRPHPDNLLGPPDLAGHIREATAAKDALAAVSARLLEFGIPE
jgi:hypothetical protein